MKSLSFSTGVQLQVHSIFFPQFYFFYEQIHDFSNIPQPHIHERISRILWGRFNCNFIHKWGGGRTYATSKEFLLITYSLIVALSAVLESQKHDSLSPTSALEATRSFIISIDYSIVFRHIYPPNDRLWRWHAFESWRTSSLLSYWRWWSWRSIEEEIGPKTNLHNVVAMNTIVLMVANIDLATCSINLGRTESRFIVYAKTRAYPYAKSW